ncbi:hypothetical protein PPL_03563 [Heterostelium album PN500]|uniref:Uncharacterized protein n=1 Tax=Heterostelium pallidum (strain ATCC 26659 / Pp 5 / PN500) TaxID=670386 RepID=D3B552_HETP5|nr:hypothetical protein PPL_03563 [Heterostelium album PN500]EFA83417.1 hypothetical protein PPL_03563 [Heterostelium album PN500]|eukprot:XP_020435534.1 hypothetical protein PPL_03563 [Heterostelium album PN500]
MSLVESNSKNSCSNVDINIVYRVFRNKYVIKRIFSFVRYCRVDSEILVAWPTQRQTETISRESKESKSLS